VALTESKRGGHLVEVTAVTSARRRNGSSESSEVIERLTDLVSENADFIWRSLRRMGVGDADVDDALQEVFLVVFRRLKDYEDRGLLRPWLFAISRQVASHYLRGRSRAERRHRGLIVEVTSEDPHEIVARREAVDIVGSFLEELDEPQRVVFYLAEIEGMTAPEIAAATGVRLNTVYARLRLARKRFEKAVERKTRREA
jgi:RNA polymerase sigma-70 factor (ECF subfamily)